MKARALRQAAIALLALTGAMPAVHAQNDPTIEACTQYAEADIVFGNAEAEAEAVYQAVRKANVEARRKAAREENKAIWDNQATMSPGVSDSKRREASDKLRAAKKNVVAVIEQNHAADKVAKAAREATIEDARTVLAQTYLAIYAEGGGMQSDVWDVMVKLLNHQRNRCTQLYGL